jgi:hypothetical protein
MAAAGLALGGLAAQHPALAAEGRGGGRGAPNLVFTQFKPSGNPGDWQMTVQNTGSNMTTGTTVVITDATGRQLWSGDIPALYGAPMFQTVSYTIHVGGFPNGVMRAVIDPANAVGESDDNASGNMMVVQLNTQVDLAVTAQDLLPGAPTDRVQFAITNKGDRDAGRFTVQVSGDKGFAQTLYLGGLTAGASQTFSLTGRQAGETVRIVANPGNTLFDYNQVNNLGISKPAAQ